MKFSIYQASRQGGRNYNQDRVAYSYSKEALLMVLADGMGGHMHGEIAAQISVQLIVEKFQAQAKPTIADPLGFLRGVILSAHDAIVNYAAAKSLTDSPRTTCVVCLVQEDRAYWAHVGDSRLYLFRGGRVVARTRDHSKVQQLCEQGQISEAQMLTHPERNKIYNCLGGVFPPEVELSRKTPVYVADTMLLCTDGLWGSLSVDEIGSILLAYPINRAIPELLDHAEFRAGQGGDNVSAVGMTWGGQGGRHRNVETETMPLDANTTRVEAFDGRVAEDFALSDEDVERAIREIQEAIKKGSDKK